MKPLDVPYIDSDEEAERLLGPTFRGVVSAARARCPPVVIFTAGLCTRCKAPCTAQMVRMPVNAPGKAEALCAVCMRRDRESKASDWFASEERAGR